jgi:hypothetical protein
MTVIGDNQLGRMFKATVMVQLEVLSWHLPGDTGENHEKSQNSRCSGNILNLSPPRYVAEVLLFELTLLMQIVVVNRELGPRFASESLLSLMKLY